MKFKLLIGSLVLLAIAFAVNTAFLRSALSDGYQVSEIKRYLILMESSSEAIERVFANNDKRLSVAEMREVLDQQRRVFNSQWNEDLDSGRREENNPDDGLVKLSIALKSGSKLVTTSRDKKDKGLPPVLVDQILEIADDKIPGGQEFVEDNEHYYVPHLLFDNQGRWIVSLIYQFRKEALRSSVAPRLKDHSLPTLLVGMFSIFGILLLYFLLAFKNRVRSKKDFVIDFVSIMLASLLCSLLINAVIFERQILEASVANARDITAEISARLDKKYSAGQENGGFGDSEPGFSESFSRFDNFDAIVITNSNGETVYQLRDNREKNNGIESTVQQVVLGRLPEQQFRVSQDIVGSKQLNGAANRAVIQISKDDIFRNLISMLIKGITILFITTLVMVECLLVFLHLLGNRRKGVRARSRYEVEFVRPAMFLFLFAIDLSMSFVPLHMQSFDIEFPGLSRDIILGLPISSEFLCAGIFLLVAGVWMDRRGWREPYFIGLFVVCLGSLFSWMATDAVTFILSRALVGVGYGLSLMSAQGLVVRFGGSRGRARGFASLFAGLYSGSICGAAAGAFMAERFGYEKVFFIGAAVVLALTLFSWSFMRVLISQDRRSSDEKQQPGHKIRLRPLLKFLGNPIFIALSVLSSLPASIAVAGFLHFFTPVYLDEIGARESTIGQVLILYGICLIYFGPSIGRLMDRSKDKKYYMLTGGVLGGLAFATFSTDLGIVSMIGCVFLLGLSSSFVLSSQSTMVLDLKESKELGEGTALGIFRSISRIGQVIGPMIFGWVLLSGDLTDVINRLGYTYIGAMMILAVFVIKSTGGLRNQKPALSK